MMCYLGGSITSIREQFKLNLNPQCSDVFLFVVIIMWPEFHNASTFISSVPYCFAYNEIVIDFMSCNF